MLNIGLCVDDRSTALKLSQVLRKYFFKNSYGCNIFEYTSDKKMLSALSSKAPVFIDIIFIRLSSPSLSYMAAKKLREVSERNERIVFLFPDDTISPIIFDVFPYSCLSLPCEEDSLFAVLDRLMLYEFEEKRLSLLIKVNGKHERLMINTIVYVESHLREVIFHLSNGTLRTCYGTLDDIQESLGKEYFLRTHKSFLLNMNYVSQMGSFFVTPLGNIPIKKNGGTAVKNVYIKYLSEHSKG